MPFHQSFTSYCREDVCSCLRNVTSPRNVTSSPVEWTAVLVRDGQALRGAGRHSCRTSEQETRRGRGNSTTSTTTAVSARRPRCERQTGRRGERVAALPHPTLNTRIADEFRRATASYDLISTHTKYAPSQRQWLTPLDDDLERGELAAFHPRVPGLARVGGGPYGPPPTPRAKPL